MINISNDTLLITILVGILAVYTIITLDDKKKIKRIVNENFTGSSGGTCSDTALTTEDDCTTANGIWTPEKSSTSGTCSDTALTTEDDCIAPRGVWTSATSGICTDLTLTNEEDCTTSSGVWTAGTSGICSDSTLTTKEECIAPTGTWSSEGNGSGDAGSNINSISEESNQNIVQSSDKKTTVVHNHYYGGNKQLAKFMNELIKKQNEENSQRNTLVDQGMCSELNNKLQTKTLAEIQNNRVLSDLKNKCDQWDDSNSTCKIQPPLSQTALLGTLLTDAKDTTYGSLLPKVNI